MSLTVGTTRSRRRAPPSLAGIWHIVIDGLRRMERASALRRELDRMDARMLSDIGVSRAQLQFEVDREA